MRSASQDLLSSLGCNAANPGHLLLGADCSAAKLDQPVAIDLAEIQDVAAFRVELDLEPLQGLCHFFLVEQVGQVPAGPAGLAEAEQGSARDA